MQKRLAAMALLLAGVCLLTATTPARADWRGGPPAVGAGTGRLTIPAVGKGKDAAPKPAPSRST